MILILFIVGFPPPGTEPALGAQQIVLATSNRINTSPGDKIKHLDYIRISFPFNFLLFVVSVFLINYSGFEDLI